MWIITELGFFSVVQKPEDEGHDTLTVRARARDDLERLRERALPSLGDIKAKGGGDYAYRATVPRSDFAKALAELAQQIDYSNFKNAVADRHSSSRAHIYSDVWSALFSITKEEAAKKVNAAPSMARLPHAYGAVFVDDGKVLLREPRNHFDGYVWTFPKGRPKGDEKPEDTAAREALEETGVSGNSLGPVPGEFAGGYSLNQYFLFERSGDPIPFKESETQSIRWASWDEARELIGRTRNTKGRVRDLAVLEAAKKAFEQLSH